MIVKNIMEKLKTVLSSACQLSLGVLFSFTVLWRVVQYFIASLLARLFNGVLRQQKFHEDDLMSFSFGILLVTILLFILGISWTDNPANT
jgi:hypothetical protein